MVESRQDSARPTRREFAAALALLGATPLVANVGIAQEQPPAPSKEVAEALAELIRARYGKHLTDEQMKSVQDSLAGLQRNAERLKRVKLTNADEPAFTFSADVP